jgi:6-phosphogluconolactonase
MVTKNYSSLLNEVVAGKWHKHKLLLLALLALGIPAFCAQKKTTNTLYRVYVGTYTGPASKGIYAFQFDPSSGKAGAVETVAETTNPSFLAVDRKPGNLYAANEISNYEGQKTGGISAFAVDPKSGKLTFLNEVSSHGAGPCHLAMDKTGRFVIVANYDSGSVAAFPVQQDGRLGEASSVIQHAGKGANAERQEGPHAHDITISDDNRFVIANDLGLDQLLVYHFDATKGILAANQPAFASVEPGAGPRHSAFHPSGRFFYSLNEIVGSISAFSYDAHSGVLRHLQTISTLPADFKDKNDSAEIVVHPSGKYLYASNRGPDTIAVFAIDGEKGTLKMVEAVPTQGRTPRNFAIDPTGKYLLAANEDSNDVAVFRIDPKTGRLTATGQVIEVPSPVCLVFVPIE